jgi:hypothetical protein
MLIRSQGIIIGFGVIFEEGIQEVEAWVYAIMTELVICRPPFLSCCLSVKDLSAIIPDPHCRPGCPAQYAACG